MNKPRLIDANEYLQKVCTYKETGCGSCKFQECCPKDQPTAYDIDEVVEQLNFEKGVAFMTLGNTGDEDYNFAYDNVMSYMNKAIEIVKKGRQE